MSVEGLPSGQRSWRCDGCGSHGTWGPGWRWLGTLGSGRAPDFEGEKIERVECPKCAAKNPQPLRLLTPSGRSDTLPTE